MFKNNKAKTLKDMTNTELLGIINESAKKAEEYKALIMDYLTKFEEADLKYRDAIEEVNSRNE